MVFPKQTRLSYSKIGQPLGQQQEIPGRLNVKISVVWLESMDYFVMFGVMTL